MAGTAGFPFFHVFHGRLVRTLLGLEQVRVAFVAAKHAGMDRVGESNVPGVFVLVKNVAGMTLDAVPFDAECFLPIMTGTTGRTPLHRFHVYMIAVTLFLEKLRVTIITAGAMYSVAEDDFTDDLGLYVDFVYHASCSFHTSHPNCVKDGR